MSSFESVVICNPARKNRDAYGTSGLMISEDWILTHGSLLSSNIFQKKDCDLTDFLVNTKLEGNIVEVPKNIADNLKFQLNCRSIDCNGR